MELSKDEVRFELDLIASDKKQAKEFAKTLEEGLPKVVNNAFDPETGVVKNLPPAVRDVFKELGEASKKMKITTDKETVIASFRCEMVKLQQLVEKIEAPQRK